MDPVSNPSPPIKNFHFNNFNTSRLTKIALIVILIILGISLTIFFGGKINKPTTIENHILQTWNKSENLIKQGKIQKPQKVLQINLHFNRDSTPSAIFKSIKLLNGYVPKPERIDQGYKLLVLDNQDQIVQKLTFDFPNRLIDDPFFAGYEQESSLSSKINPSIELSEVDKTLTINYQSNFQTLQILSPSNELLSSKDLDQIEDLKIIQDFKSIPGEDNQTSSFLDRLIQNVNAESTDNKLDLVFISQGPDSNLSKGFATEQSFQQYINQTRSFMLNIEPFKTRQSQINFSYVYNNNDLGCPLYDKTNYPRLIICDDSKVIQKVQERGAPYDKIVVIMNSDYYGGSGGDATSDSVVAVASVLIQPEGITHEIGHLLGRLLDEYVVPGDIPIEWPGTKPNQVYRNCFVGTPTGEVTDPHWQGISSSQFSQGCGSRQNWYRSSQNSIMKEHNAHYFNLVSQKYLNEAIDYYAGPFQSAPTQTTTPTTNNSTPTTSPSQTGKPNPDPSLGQVKCSIRTCVYSEGAQCFKGNCKDGSENCTFNRNCGYVEACSGSGKRLVTCPEGNLILNSNGKILTFGGIKIGADDTGSIEDIRNQSEAVKGVMEQYSQILDQISQKSSDPSVTSALLKAKESVERSKSLHQSCLKS